MKAPEYSEGDDEWGLSRRPPNFILDTPDDLAERTRKVAGAMKLLLTKATEQIGEAAALELWKSTVAKGRGRPSRPANPEVDRLLLDLYDGVGRRVGYWKDLPRKLALYCNETAPGKYGPSSEAIEKHLRDLLKRREQRDRHMYAACTWLTDRTQVSLISEAAQLKPSLSNIKEDKK